MNNFKLNEDFIRFSAAVLSDCSIIEDSFFDFQNGKFDVNKFKEFKKWIDDIYSNHQAIKYILKETDDRYRTSEDIVNAIRDICNNIEEFYCNKN